METSIFQLNLRQHSTYQYNYAEIIPKNQNTRKESHRKNEHIAHKFSLSTIATEASYFFQEEKKEEIKINEESSLQYTSSWLFTFSHHILFLISFIFILCPGHYVKLILSLVGCIFWLNFCFFHSRR